MILMRSGSDSSPDVYLLVHQQPGRCNTKCVGLVFLLSLTHLFLEPKHPFLESSGDFSGEIGKISTSLKGGCGIILNIHSFFLSTNMYRMPVICQAAVLQTERIDGNTVYVSSWYTN